MKMGIHSEFNRMKTLELLNSRDSLDLIKLGTVTSRVNNALLRTYGNLDNREKYVVVGEYPAFLAGLWSWFPRPYRYTPHDDISNLKESKWFKRLSYDVRLHDPDAMKIFGSIAIHYIDDDAYRFVCIYENEEWVLYTCFAGQEYLITKKYHYRMIYYISILVGLVSALIGIVMIATIIAISTNPR